MATYFKNPQTGYVEKATGLFTGLWIVLFGTIYFAYKGVWGLAVARFIATLTLVAIGLTVGMGAVMSAIAGEYAAVPSSMIGFWLVSFVTEILFVIFGYSGIRRHYHHKGWVQRNPRGEFPSYYPTGIPEDPMASPPISLRGYVAGWPLYCGLLLAFIVGIVVFAVYTR